LRSTPSPPSQPPPGGEIERREDVGEVHLRGAADALERGAAGRRHVDHHHAPIAVGRFAPHPAALDHRADRVRHRRQAHALERGEVAEHARGGR
jgi:hypothetical protein